MISNIAASAARGTSVRLHAVPHRVHACFQPQRDGDIPAQGIDLGWYVSAPSALRFVSFEIDFDGLGLLVEQPVRDIDYQHRQLTSILDEQSLMNMFTRIANLLNLKNKRIFLVDPHHEEYTGIQPSCA